MSTQVSESITRKSASNLALAFILLPKPKREGMATLYAFCRQVDDIADEDRLPVDERRRTLAAWRADVRRACAGGEPKLPVIREMAPFIEQYRLPYDLFDELIQGVEMDLETVRYGTYDELELYCYRVASVVGLLSIEIFGYKDPQCRPYAVALGKALQFTNILRDIRNDAERGRIYLPGEALDRHRVSVQEILSHTYSDRFHALSHEVAGRARGFYRSALELLPEPDRKAMVAAELMGSVYWKLLLRLEARRFNVFAPNPTRVSKLHKVLLVLRAWYRLNLGHRAPNYGVP